VHGRRLIWLIGGAALRHFDRIRAVDCTRFVTRFVNRHP